MKKAITIIVVALILILLSFSVFFYFKNLKGIWPAILPAKGNIGDLINTQSFSEQTINKTGLPLKLPRDYIFSIFADNLGSPRDILEDSEGNIVVSLTKQGKVVVLPDKNNDGKADNIVVLVENLNRPHGLLFKNNQIFIAESDNVSWRKYDQANLKVGQANLLTSMSSGGNHFTRSLIFHPTKENKLLVSIGSSCNVCLEKARALIFELDLSNGSRSDFATGLRNSVFMAVRPGTNEIWATEMGRDLIGDDIPPDEINIINNGNNYGWPYCYGKNVHDTNFDASPAAASICKISIPSNIDLQAHSSPLGLAFLDKNNLLVAYHGSWNRSAPTGYKIMLFTLDDNGNEISREDFITGWLDGNQALGRPVDIFIAKSGKIYISDDKAGVIYLLTPMNLLDGN